MNSPLSSYIKDLRRAISILEDELNKGKDLLEQAEELEENYIEIENELLEEETPQLLELKSKLEKNIENLKLKIKDWLNN
ncbi:MAG: hypothetical protein QXY70_01915 [Nanopusillaceae archaeon]